MPLDPLDAYRLGDVERNVDDLSRTSAELSRRTIVLNARLRVAEARNKGLWAALLVSLLGSIFTGVYWAGSMDASLKAQGKRIDELGAAIKGLEHDLREHERRPIEPKPSTK